MLELLFNNQNTERVFFTLLKQKKCYAKNLSKTFGTAIFGFQNTLLKLEKIGILISYKEGNTRLFLFNPRYPFLKELTRFLEKAYQFLPKEIIKKYYEDSGRTRPRRTGKPL